YLIRMDFAESPVRVSTLETRLRAQNDVDRCGQRSCCNSRGRATRARVIRKAQRLYGNMIWAAALSTGSGTVAFNTDRLHHAATETDILEATVDWHYLAAR